MLFPNRLLYALRRKFLTNTEYMFKVQYFMTLSFVLDRSKRREDSEKSNRYKTSPFLPSEVDFKFSFGLILILIFTT